MRKVSQRVQREPIEIKSDEGDGEKGEQHRMVEEDHGGNGALQLPHPRSRGLHSRIHGMFHEEGFNEFQ